MLIKTTWTFHTSASSLLDVQNLEGGDICCKKWKWRFREGLGSSLIWDWEERGAFTVPDVSKLGWPPGSAGRLQIIIFGTPGEIRRQTSAWLSKGSYAKNNHWKPEGEIWKDLLISIFLLLGIADELFEVNKLWPGSSGRHTSTTWKREINYK